MTIEFFFKLLRYSRAFRERELGLAGLCECAAATGVHAVHPILPGPGKDFWLVYRIPQLG